MPPKGGLARLLVDVDRNAVAVIGDPHPTVLEDDDIDEIAATGERFVDRVVDDFIDQMMEPALIGAPDIHTGPTADGLEAFEDLNVSGSVGRRLRLTNGFYQSLPLVSFVLRSWAETLKAFLIIRHPGRC